MGETSRGKSPTSPTFSRLRSRRTRMERQYSQVVCTAPDQRNCTNAPQFGQLAAGWLMGRRKIRPLDAPHVDCAGRELAPQILAEIPFRARPAAEDVEAKRMILGKGVAGKMRFGKQAHSRDAARSRELMEGGIAYGMEQQRFREPAEKGAQLRKISQRRRVT